MDIGAYLILSLFLEVPRIIGAIVAFYLAKYSGGFAFKSGGSRGTSLIFAISIFFILDFAFSFITRSEMSLMSAAASGAHYYYLLVWLPKLIVVLGLYFVLSKRFSVPQQPAPAHSALKATPILAVCALIAVALSLYSIYSASTAITQGLSRLQETQNKAEVLVQGQADTIRAGLENYKSANGTYPQNLEILVPNFVQSIPLNPYEFPQEYTVLAGGADYQLCVYTTLGQKCITAHGAWSDLKRWCDRDSIFPASQNQRFPVVGRDC